MGVLKRLLAGCWLSGHEWYRDRGADGRLAECCLVCGQSRAVLAGKVIIGPAHYAQPDLGAVRTKARSQVSSIRERRRA